MIVKKLNNKEYSKDKDWDRDRKIWLFDFIK